MDYPHPGMGKCDNLENPKTWDSRGTIYIDN